MIRELRIYPAYKPSGVDWIGDVPAHWEVRRLRTVAEMRVSNVDKHVKDDELPVRLCNYVDVYKNDRITEDITFMRATATASEIERFRLEICDVLITKDSETWNDIGVPALVEHTADDLVCGYHLALLRPSKRSLDGAFLLRALQNPTIGYQFHVSANGVTRYGLTHEAIKSVLVPLPPLSEQRAIARYLDHVDRRIQRYIEVKEKSIALLQEARQATIQRAVTRGLDPSVPLKASGIEWIGDVPAHWEVRRLRTVAEMRVSNVDKHVKDGELPVRLCNYVDVYKNDRITEDIAFMRATATASETERFQLEVGDVLITKDSETWNDIGVPALVEHTAEDLVCGYHLALLRPAKRSLDGAYLLRALQSPTVGYQFHVSANGVTRYGLTHEAIKSVHLPLPPLPEQRAIFAYLDRATAGIDAAIDNARRQVEFMTEYRASLIAHVVTGKLDVRAAAERTGTESARP